MTTITVRQFYTPHTRKTYEFYDGDSLLFTVEWNMVTLRMESGDITINGACALVYTLPEYVFKSDYSVMPINEPWFIAAIRKISDTERMN